MAVSRRKFLAYTALGAGATVAGRTLGLDQTLAQSLAEAAPAANAPAVSWVPSVCLQCPGGCGIMVKTVDGRAVKIEGNPAHPGSRGRLCPKGQTGLQVLYDPDRIKYPLRRVGARGENKWERISWDAALQTVAAKLKDLREKNLSHTAAVVGGRWQGEAEALFGRLFSAYGSPNVVKRGATCSQAAKFGVAFTQGIEDHMARDWKNANYVMLFGYSMLEASRPLTWLLGTYGEMRRGRPIRAKIVAVDPRRSITAAKADEWVPIRPGTDAAFALALAHVLIRENLYDQDFIANHTTGFEAFRDLVLESYSPAAAAAITGVPAETTERLARELGSTRPASVDAGDKGTSGQSNGAYTRMAIHSLNALLGTIDAPGGILVQRKVGGLGKLPAVEQDDTAKNGLKQPRVDLAKTAAWPFGGNVYPQFFASAAQGKPYPVEAMFVYYTNPLLVQPDVATVRAAYDRIPFIVDFSPFMSDSARLADLILPDHSYLEREELVPVGQGPGQAVLGLRRPVVKPLYDTMQTSDFILRLGQALGGTIARSLPWASNHDVVQTLLAPRPEVAAALNSHGVFAEGPYKYRQWDQVLPTASKRFEFVSDKLKGALAKLQSNDAELNRLGISARGETVYMPHYEPVRYSGGSPEQYPLILNTFKPATRPEGRVGNQPFLLESWGVEPQVRWDSWVDIHPKTAAALGIASGDQVVVESRVGKLTTRAHVTDGTLPEVVNMPHGVGHEAYGRFGAGVGVNPNRIIEGNFDFLVGQVAWFQRVRIFKA